MESYNQIYVHDVFVKLGMMWKAVSVVSTYSFDNHEAKENTIKSI